MMEWYCHGIKCLEKVDSIWLLNLSKSRIMWWLVVTTQASNMVALQKNTSKLLELVVCGLGFLKPNILFNYRTTTLTWTFTVTLTLTYVHIVIRWQNSDGVEVTYLNFTTAHCVKTSELTIPTVSLSIHIWAPATAISWYVPWLFLLTKTSPSRFGGIGLGYRCNSV